MSLTVAANTSSIKPLPATTYVARCVMLVDLGTQPGYTHAGVTTAPKRKILIQWEFPTELIEGGDYDGKPRVFSDEYGLSLHEKANLYKLLVAWRGRKFTEEELKGFNLVAILGAPCVLQLGINEKDYNTLLSIQPINPKIQAPCPPQITPSVAFDFDLWREGDTSQNTIYANLPEWIQKKINNALELSGSSSTTTTTNTTTTTQDMSDDIPF